jgi:hypothetical protein
MVSTHTCRAPDAVGLRHKRVASGAMPCVRARSSPSRRIVAAMHKAKACRWPVCTINPNPLLPMHHAGDGREKQFVQMLQALVQVRDSSIILSDAPGLIAEPLFNLSSAAPTFEETVPHRTTQGRAPPHPLRGRARYSRPGAAYEGLHGSHREFPASPVRASGALMGKDGSDDVARSVR